MSITISSNKHHSVPQHPLVNKTDDLKQILKIKNINKNNGEPLLTKLQIYNVTDGYQPEYSNTDKSSTLDPQAMANLCETILELSAFIKLQASSAQSLMKMQDMFINMTNFIDESSLKYAKVLSANLVKLQAELKEKMEAATHKEGVFSVIFGVLEAVIPIVLTVVATVFTGGAALPLVIAALPGIALGLSDGSAKIYGGAEAINNPDGDYNALMQNGIFSLAGDNAGKVQTIVQVIIGVLSLGIGGISSIPESLLNLTSKELVPTIAAIMKLSNLVISAIGLVAMCSGSSNKDLQTTMMGVFGFCAYEIMMASLKADKNLSDADKELIAMVLGVVVGIVGTISLESLSPKASIDEDNNDNNVTKWLKNFINENNASNSSSNLSKIQLISIIVSNIAELNMAMMFGSSVIKVIEAWGVLQEQITSGEIKMQQIIAKIVEEINDSLLQVDTQLSTKTEKDIQTLATQSYNVGRIAQESINDAFNN